MTLLVLRRPRPLPLCPPQEKRLHAMRRAARGPTYGDDKIGPVDNIQLQREMRRRAMLEAMKQNAWAGSFNPRGPGQI